jgi:hypothetical protein
MDNNNCGVNVTVNPYVIRLNPGHFNLVVSYSGQSYFNTCEANFNFNVFS